MNTNIHLLYIQNFKSFVKTQTLNNRFQTQSPGMLGIYPKKVGRMTDANVKRFPFGLSSEVLKKSFWEKVELNTHDICTDVSKFNYVLNDFLLSSPS